MLHPSLAIVVAVDENSAIGRNGDLLCYLPNDLRHFKKITEGHTVIMGRRTFESLPKGALPNRTNMVITSDAVENYPNCIVVRSLDEAIEKCKDDTSFIIGGGKLYATSLHLVDTLHLTRIHHVFEDADTFFPEVDGKAWRLVEKEEHQADEKHAYNYTFMKYVRVEK